MSAFRESVKSAFRQVFGHADIEGVLNDHWEFDSEFPQAQRDAMRPQEAPQAATKPMKQRKPRPSPTPRLAPLPPRPVNLAALPESVLPPDPEPPEPPPPAVGGLLLTEGAPHAAQTLDAIGTSPDDFALLLEQAAFSAGDDDEAPPGHETLDITGSGSPAPSPPAESLVAAMPLRLTPLPPRPALRLAAAEDGLPEGSCESTSIDGIPEDRLADGGALPPADIWDDVLIRAELLDDLASSLRVCDDPSEERVLRALQEALQEDDLDFPPFPPAARRIVGEGGAAISDEDLIDVVRTDIALAGKLMKVANSPAYLAASPVASINAAVVRIGLDQVRRVIVAASIGESYKVAGYESVMAHLRLHSVGTGMAAELLAISSSVNPAEAFLAGLLHDVGEALVYRIVRKRACEDSARGDDWFPDRRVLRRLARRHHLRLGALFLGTWDLAAHVASAIAYHHHPEHAEPRYLEIAALIHIADEIALRAVQHVHSPAWKSHLALRGIARNSKELSAAVDADGFDEVTVADLLACCPRGWDEERLRGVLRSVALRLDGNDLDAIDGSATLASMTL
jgi:HD-like signal output (HDOD) protein